MDRAASIHPSKLGPVVPLMTPAGVGPRPRARRPSFRYCTYRGRSRDDAGGNWPVPPARRDIGGRRPDRPPGHCRRTRGWGDPSRSRRRAGAAHPCRAGASTRHRHVKRRMSPAPTGHDASSFPRSPRVRRREAQQKVLSIVGFKCWCEPQRPDHHARGYSSHC